MTTTNAGFQGKPPGVLIQPIPNWKPKNPEQVKYEKLWSGEDYRRNSPGESKVLTFMSQSSPQKDAEVTCFGCGSGREALMLGLFGMKVLMLDFTENCLDPEVAQACETQNGRIRFQRQDLTETIDSATAYGFCCDVMEHIPTDDVQKVLRNILSSAQHVFFGISTVDDEFGKTIGQPLHLTVKPLVWWVDQLRQIGAVVHWSSSDEISCDIYCSNWQDAGELTKTGKINITDEMLNENISKNIEGDWLQAGPHNRQDKEIIILAGGPSMKDDLETIRRLREEDGCYLITVNGSYNWAIENGLTPSMQILLDGREWNKRFVVPQVDTCKYLIASQCHPSVLEGLPHDRTLLWHACVDDTNADKITAKYGSFYPVPGGSTVVLRAIPLLRMLGFYRMHIFGFDSCISSGGQHHSYEQKENDGAPIFPLTCGGRTFECAPWMMSQASEFRDVVQFLGDEVELAIYGDGLIKHMLVTGATFANQTTSDKEI